MDKLLNWGVESLCVMAIWIAAASAREHDICYWKSFSPTCSDTEVIAMEEALYGRMSVGECIVDDFLIGCKLDVVDYLHRICSGRQSCQLKLPDEELGLRQPCRPGVESYLHVRYNCVTVHTSPTECKGKPLTISQPYGVLANAITGRTGQGSADCPWEVRGSPGQRIRLTVQDFRLGEDSGSAVATVTARSGVCYRYATITEERAEGSFTLCGDGDMTKVTYTSQAERVQIALTDPKLSQKPVYFLLKYEVSGCLDYVPPEGAVKKPHGNGILVTCPNTKYKWRVTCNGVYWTTEGEVTNCTVLGDRAIPFSKDQATQTDELTLAHMFLMAIIVSIAVLIAVSVLGFAICCFRRKRQPEMPPMIHQLNDLEENPQDGYTSKEHHPMLGKTQGASLYHRQREDMSSTQRQGAAPPGAVIPGGEFPPLPPLPLPPPANCTGTCRVHGTVGHPNGDIERATLKYSDTNQNHQSPDLLRSTRRERPLKNHFYYELDPEHIDYKTGVSPQNMTADKSVLGPCSILEV